MHPVGVPAILAAGALISTLAAASAGAACGDRPGTPNEVAAQPSPGAPMTSIRLSWRNTTARAHSGTPHSGYFDIWVRASENGPNIGEDKTGFGPFHNLRYGTRSYHDFPNLAPGTRRCFQMRARTGAGTSGCLSASGSNWACATTSTTPPAAPAPSSGTSPVKRLGKVMGITVTQEPDNVFVVKSASMHANAPVTIRVVDDALNQVFITTIGGRRIVADAKGHFEVRLYGLCKASGTLHFTANDGRKSTTDRTGVVWTAPRTGTCRV